MSSINISISDKLRETEQLFSEAGIPSPRLDAEVLLAHALGVTRPYLHAHSDKELGSEEVGKLESYTKRRLKREPVAYITGKKEFYGREFIMTPDVLIPRPETEVLVELCLTHYKDFPCSKENPCRLLDVGCGSGCIGITLKVEQPELNVTLCDISPKALAVAKKNSERFDAHVEFIGSNLLSQFLPSKIQNLKSKIYFDVIVANLPYVDTSWETSPETAYEPDLALYAKDGGLKLIKKLIEQSADVLNERGLLLLEADPEQHEKIIVYAKTFRFTLKKTEGYALAFTKQLRA